MEFFDLIRTRRSIRRFSKEDVLQDDIGKILEAVNLAPTAGNLQAFEVFVTRDPKKMEALSRAAYGQGFVAQAKACLIFCAHANLSSAKYGKRGAELYSVQDATIATTFALLAISQLGLATTWVGAFQDDMVSEVLGVSSDLRPVAILPIGHPAQSPSPTSRRELADLVHDLDIDG